VEAGLCLAWRYGPGPAHTGPARPALAANTAYSLLAVSTNCGLVCGALARRPAALLPWLGLYGLAALGSLALAALLPLTVLDRDRQRGDIDLLNILWCLLPFGLFLCYAILWCFIFRVYRKFRKDLSDVYYVRT